MGAFFSKPNTIEKSNSHTNAREAVAALTEQLSGDYIKFVDDNVAGCLPPGSRIKGIIPSGQAYWTLTAAIETEQADGSPATFFLKISYTDLGKHILHGEYTSINLIREAVPDFAPVTLASGSYSANANVHFNLFRYVEMTGTFGELEKLPAKLAELHKKAISPNGKYGFSVPTSQGALIQPNKWTCSWERFFSNMIQRCFDWEQDLHGSLDEMQQLFVALKAKVIPRLLRPLETGGREIQPCLVHGDLWDGNTSTVVDTDEAIIFDASSLYAHHEYDLGPWNIPRHQINNAYISAYHENFPFSEPREDMQDRLILYRLRFNIVCSGCYLDDLSFREVVIEDMKYLTEKYPKGFEGSELCKAELTNEPSLS